LLAACSNAQFYHDHFMKGSVVSVNDDMVVLCLGESDGIEPGTKLNVFTTIFDGAIEEGTDNNYRGELVGVISIHSVFDQHFARANILSGTVTTADFVDLPE